MNISILKQPSAWLPIAMSLAALAFTLSYLAVVGLDYPRSQHDEGGPAHLFQLLIAGQMPIVLWFAISWLPRAPVRALQVLALQLAAIGAALFPVFWLGM